VRTCQLQLFFLSVFWLLIIASRFVSSRQARQARQANCCFRFCPASTGAFLRPPLCRTSKIHCLNFYLGTTSTSSTPTHCSLYSCERVVFHSFPLRSVSWLLFSPLVAYLGNNLLFRYIFCSRGLSPTERRNSAFAHFLRAAVNLRPCSRKTTSVRSLCERLILKVVDRPVSSTVILSVDYLSVRLTPHSLEEPSCSSHGTDRHLESGI